MKKIETYQKLQAERRLAKLEIARLEAQIEQDVQDIKESLNPARVAGKALNNLLSSERSGVVGESIDLAIDGLIKNLLLKNSNWVVRLATTFFLKNYAKNIFSKNAADIRHWIRNKIKPADDSKAYHAADDVNWDV